MSKGSTISRLFITTLFFCMQALNAIDQKNNDESEDKKRNTIAYHAEFDTPNYDDQANSNFSQQAQSFDNWQLIEETFQKVCDQTSKIEFCLQQVEQILNSGKMKFNHAKISKSQLLQEIKELKHAVLNMGEANQLNPIKHEAIFQGILCNATLLDYLLPIMQNDITNLNTQAFYESVPTKFEALLATLQDDAEFFAMIEANDQNIEKLIAACDDIGLNTFNKIYRYLDTKTVPWYGKSILSTGYDIALWGSAAALATTVILYMYLPYHTTIPGTKKIFNPTEKEIKYNENNYIEPVIWEENGTNYTRKTIEDIVPFKRYFGDLHDTELSKSAPDKKERAQLKREYGIYSHLDNGVQASAKPFPLAVGGILAYMTYAPLQEMYKKYSKKFTQWFTYHVKGDASMAKGSQDYTKAYFSDFVGGEHLEQLAHQLVDYLKNPTRYERAGIAPSTGYLLVGPAQTGKSYFAKALKTLIDEEFGDKTDTIKFATVTQDDMEYFKGFANIFYWARKSAPIILFIDEIDMYNVRRERNEKNTQELLTAMNGIDTDPSKKVIVVAATNRPEELDFALKQKGRLGDLITFDYPTYENRKEYIERQLAKRNIAISPNMIDIIAQETGQQTFNMLDTIIKHALRRATFQTRLVGEADFEAALDYEIRKIKPNATLSLVEQELISIYQAGQAVARHILDTDQKIVKISIDSVDKNLGSKEGHEVKTTEKGNAHENYELLTHPRAKLTRLGFIFTVSTTNNPELLSDAQQEKEILALLAGQASLELIKQTTFGEFGKEDRAQVLDILEKKIAQGNPITEKIREQALAQKAKLYAQIKAVLGKHTPFIQTITDELMTSRTISQKRWIELSSNYQM